MRSFANGRLAKLPNIRLSTTSSQGHLYPLGSQSLRNPSGWQRQDGKRPDGLTLIPWQRGKPLTWDVTVAHTLADSEVSATARSGGAAAEQARWMSHLLLSFRSWAARSRLFQETTESPAFLSSAFPSLFSALTRSCSTTVSLYSDEEWPLQLVDLLLTLLLTLFTPKGIIKIIIAYSCLTLTGGSINVAYDMISSGAQIRGHR